MPGLPPITLQCAFAACALQLPRGAPASAVQAPRFWSAIEHSASGEADEQTFWPPGRPTEQMLRRCMPAASTEHWVWIPTSGEPALQKSSRVPGFCALQACRRVAEPITEHCTRVSAAPKALHCEPTVSGEAGGRAEVGHPYCFGVAPTGLDGFNDAT